MFASAVATLLVISVTPALAGGSWLEPSWERVEPGDHVELSGEVFHGALGWLDDGPFFAYLSGSEHGLTIDEGKRGPTTDVPLGPLLIDQRNNRLNVSVDFELDSDIQPGEYWVLVCNDPCTTGLGDLVGGILYVGVDPPPLEEELTDVAPEQPELSTASLAIVSKTADEPRQQRSSRYLALGPYPDRPSPMSPLWIGISMAIAGSVLVGALVIRQGPAKR